MNSEEIVFFDFYIRKNRFSALIFYLSKENEWKNEEFVRKNEEFGLRCGSPWIAHQVC